LRAPGACVQIIWSRNRLIRFSNWMSVSGRFQQLIESKATTGICRQRKLIRRLSTSAMEKADLQI
jgi:hypothetical protein